MVEQVNLPRGSSQISLEGNRNGTYTVKLSLELEGRYIGTLQPADGFGNGGTFFCKRSERHLHRKTNSLGLNYSLLTNPQFKFKWIAIEFEGRKLVTSRAFWLARGMVFHFGKAGFELQSFPPLDEFGIDKARGFEAIQQPELFPELCHD
ncbi:MAG: hypothetical protein M1470_13270 [Bacteroidetes bacterium]|nr:hypothetical protein [Bacteroidota bacterium]